MSKKSWILPLTLLAAGTMVAAQERDGDEETNEPRRQIRVLEHPYDIASFYRSDGGSGPGYFSYHAPYEFDGDQDSRFPIANAYRQGGDPRYPIAGAYRQEGDSRYAIAGYYRQGAVNPRGYGRFWNAAPAPRLRGGVIVSHRRRVAGCRGELLLVAPTILGGVLPLGHCR